MSVPVSSTVRERPPVDARRRLKRYRRCYGDDALLLVEAGALSRPERQRAVALAAAYGAQIGFEATNDPRLRGIPMPCNGIFRHLIQPLCEDWLGLANGVALHPADCAWWEAVRADGMDCRADAFRYAWTGVTAFLGSMAARPRPLRVSR